MMNTTPKNETPATNGGAPTGTAMVLGSDAYRGALEPTSTTEAWQIAEMMASIGYCGVTSAPEALGRIMTGRGLGLSAMQSMRGIYTVHGRPGIDAALMHALCLQSPLCEYFDFVPEESDEAKATFRTKRAGREETRYTFTIEDAAKMGVLEREDAKKTADSNWTKVRKAMLRARAKSELARIVYPDLIFGMYSREEIEAGYGDAPPPRDPNEMVGDILTREEEQAAAGTGTGGVVSTVQAAKRDYGAEAKELIAKITAATTRAARAEVRAAFDAWDGIDPYRAQVQEAYNATRKAAAAAADVGASAPAGTAANPAPIPDGGLFAGNAPKGDGK
jgi:hypothetical protein